MGFGVCAGIIRCQLMEGHIDDAEQQLEFLAEIQQSIGKSGVRNHFNDLLCYLKNQRELLKQCYTESFSRILQQNEIKDKEKHFCRIISLFDSDSTATWFINPLMLCLSHPQCVTEPVYINQDWSGWFSPCLNKHAHLLSCICRGTDV